MRLAAWLFTATVLATACTSTTAHPVAVASASPVPHASASPSSPPPSSEPPASGICDSTHRCLALVTLRGSDRLVVRDITDINHPSTVATLAPLSDLQFVNGSEVSFVDDQTGSIVRMPLNGSTRTTLASSNQLVGYTDWSPDGSSLVYLTASADNTTMTLHRLSGGQDLVVGDVPAIPGVGCESIASCPSDVWDARLLYARDGSAISWMTSVVKPAFRLWSADGKLLKSSDLSSEAMSVWSGGSLYFRDGKGVEVWRDGVVSPFLPGVAWIRPKASPGGGQIVYEVRDAARWSHSYVVDTVTGHVRDLGRAHAEPVFLTARFIWYEGERACVPADGCGDRVAGVASGKTYIYDLQTGMEYESVITNVYDVWPHAA